jgi:galactokinase
MSIKPAIVEHVAARFSSHFQTKPKVLSWAPGRINIIGEHTDYNDGLALPAAINRYVAMAIAPRDDKQIIFQSENYDEVFVIDVDQLATLKPEKSWHRYMVGTLCISKDLGCQLGGMSIMLTGDIPAGSGLSSSAALILALLGGLVELNQIEFDAWKLVKASQRVEHEYLGVKCGLLDQIGSQMSVAESAYQTRVTECQQALERMSALHPHVKTLRDIKDHDIQGDDTLAKRIRHVTQENKRVKMALEYIQNDPENLGKTLYASHQSLRDDYEVSCDELNAMVEIARRHKACVGSRMMGGGFGGSTLNLVKTENAQEFVDTTLAEYQKQYPDLKTSALIAELVGGADSVTL